MKRIWIAALCAASTAVVAAAPQVYRWVDSSGTVHYTDKPPNPGAAPVQLPAIQTYKAGTSSDPFAGGTGGGPAPAAAQVLALVSPRSEETLRDADGHVSMAVNYELKPGQGVVFLIDDAAQNPEPVQDTAYTAQGVVRGAHTAAARVVDEQGTEITHSTPVTFYMMPPRVNMGPAGAPGSPVHPPR